MAKLKNGMIVFMRDPIFPGPKLLDIEITNTFPLIALTEKVYLLTPSKGMEVLEGYDHVAIPADLRLHITGPKEHIFFNATPLWDLFGNRDSIEPFHYFSVIGLPSRSTQELVKPGKTRIWNQGEIIFPFKDVEFNESTRLFIDFFLHSSPVNSRSVYEAPFFMEGLRLAADRDGSIIGPYSFESIQRRKKLIKNIAFSIRFGFANIEDNESMYVFTPLEIFQKRPRS